MFGNPFPEPPIVLLMLSGGIDSAYLLHHYLQETDLRVHAHHVSIRYPHLQRWRAEDPATERIVSWCREHLREFEYTTSRFDMDITCVGWDADIHLLVASKLALNLGEGPVTVVRGICVDDVERESVRRRGERGVTKKLWEALCLSTIRPNIDLEVSFPLVEQGLTKADVVARMPAELLELTWSCRKPLFDEDEPKSCGECHACGLRTQASG